MLTEQKDVKNPDGSLRFSVSEINAIPIGGYALQLIAMLVFASLSSRTGKRARWIVVQMVSIWSNAKSTADALGHYACWVPYTINLAGVVWGEDGWIFPTMAEQLWWTDSDRKSQISRYPPVPLDPLHIRLVPADRPTKHPAISLQARRCSELLTYPSLTNRLGWQTGALLQKSETS